MSIQESNTAEKMGKQLAGSMKYWQAERIKEIANRQKLGAKRKGSEETDSRNRKGRNGVLKNLPRVAQTSIK